MVNGKTFGIVTTCKNREQYLKMVLFSWERLMPKYVDRIIVVDWGSDKPLEINPTKAEILRVRNKRFYDGGKARNLGIRYCDTHWIFMVDSDVIIQANDQCWQGNVGFFELLLPHLAPGNVYIRQPNNNVDGSITGSILFERSMWEKAGGYGENFIGWGFEDVDFQNRLRTAGAKHQCIFNANFLHHIPHDDNSRIRGFLFSNQDKWYTANYIKQIVHVVDYGKQQKQKQCVDIYDNKLPPRTQYV